MAEPTRSSRSSSIPANYVSIVDLRDRWMKQKQQQQQEKQEGSGSGSGSGDGGGHSEPQKQQQGQQQLHHRRQQQQQLQSHQPQEDLAPAQVEINGVVEVEKEEENDRCLGVLPREDYDDDGEKADHANSAQNPTHLRDRLPPPHPRYYRWSKPRPQNLRWIRATCLNQPGLLPLPEKKETGRTIASTTSSSVVVSVVPETATALALKAEDRLRTDEAPPRALKEEAGQKNEMKGGNFKKNKNRIRNIKRERKKWWSKINQDENKADSSQEEDSEEAVEKLETAITAAAVIKSVSEVAVAVAFPTNSGVIPKTTSVPADSTPDKYWSKNNHQEKNKGSKKETATSAVNISLAVPIKGVSAGNIGLRKGKYMPERIRSGVLVPKRTSVPDESATAEIERRLSKLSTGDEDKTETRNSFRMSTASTAEPVSVRRDRSYGGYCQGRNYTAKQVRETRGVVWVKKGVSPDSSGSYPD